MKSRTLVTSAACCVAVALLLAVALDEDQAAVIRYELMTLFLGPLFQLGWKTGALQKLFRVSFDDSGFTYSRGVITRAHFDKIRQYTPTENDVFIVTFPKSGTHYTVQMTIQVLGDGEVHFESVHERMAILEIEQVSPKTPGCEGKGILWIDNLKEPRKHKNVIATHMPQMHVPHSNLAKYIVVVRDPVDTLLSNVEVMKKVIGERLAPGLLDVYGMLFESGNNSWPEYYRALWEARERDNLLFLFYEDAAADPAATIKLVAKHLGKSLSDSALEKVRHLCSYKYMKKHAAKFEPPSCIDLLPISPPKSKLDMVNKGKAGRGKEKIPKDLQRRILERVFTGFKGSDFPVERYTKSLDKLQQDN